MTNSPVTPRPSATTGRLSWPHVCWIARVRRQALFGVISLMVTLAGAAALAATTTNLTLVSSYDTSGNCVGLAVSGNRVYLADSEEPSWTAGQGLVILDMKNPASPRLLGKYDSPGSALGITLRDELGFLADGPGGLRVLDLSNPAAPVLIGHLDTAGDAREVALAGNRAYLVDSNNYQTTNTVYGEGLLVLDISNPRNPVRLGSFATMSPCGVAVLGDYACLADAASGLQVLDVSDPTAIRRVWGIAHAGGLAVWDVALSGHFAFVADSSNGFQIRDITQPHDPLLVGSLPPFGYLKGVAVSGQTVYQAGFDRGLQVVDVSDPRRPRQLARYADQGQFHELGELHAVAVAAEWVFAAAGQRGLKVFKWGAPQPPTISKPLQDRVVETGDHFALSVPHAGSIPLDYQWLHAGTNLVDAARVRGSQTDRLTISNATPSDIGIYGLRITNPSGSTESAARMLVVPAGAPRLRADGEEVLTTAVRGLQTRLSLSSSLPGGLLLYTLDGSAPTFASTEYAEPVLVTNSVTVRAIVYNSDFTIWIEAGPWEVQVVPIHTLTTGVQGQGTVQLSPLGGQYPEGTTVNASAMAADGWRFVGWLGDTGGSSKDVRVVMDRPQTLTAVFEELRMHRLTALTAGGGVIQGSVTNTYEEGTTLTLRAVADPGWEFMYWEGDISSVEAQVNVSMTQPMRVEAVFGTRVNTTAVGPGHNELQPATDLHRYGSTVLVIGVPDSGNYLGRWGGAGSGTFNPFPLVVTNPNPTVSAIYGPIPVGQAVLTTRIQGDGHIIASPARNIFTGGEVVTLSAVAHSGTAFSNWGGGATGTNTSVSILMDGNRTVAAEFVLGSRVEVTTTGQGRVDVNPPLDAYVPGRTVQLAPVPDAGWRFVEWLGDAAGSAIPYPLVMSADRRVQAVFERIPGTVVWTQVVSGANFWGSPALGHNGMLYVGGFDTRMYAFDAGTGMKRWSYATQGRVMGSASVGTDGTVYFGSEDTRVYALDGATGHKRWEFKAEGGVQGTPALGTDGRVYCGSIDGNLYALDSGSGVKRWQFQTGGAVELAVVIGHDGTVYVASYSRKVYALNPETGAKRWEHSLGSVIWYPPALGGDGTLFFGVDSSLLALNGTTGSRRWTVQPPASLNGPVSLDSTGLLFALGANRKVYAFDISSGSGAVKAWEFPAGAGGGGLQSTPAVGRDGVVYFGEGEGGRVYAVAGRTGVKLWEYNTGAWATAAPTLGPDGTLYVTTSRSDSVGKLFAIATGSRGWSADSPWSMFQQNPQHTGRASAQGPTRPSIALPPKGQIAIAGQQAFLEVMAAGTPPLQYQWHKDSLPLPGATNASLALPGAGVADAGNYTVVVSNALGTATSPSALLVVHYSLATASWGSGTVTREPSQTHYPPGGAVRLSATPDSGFTFVGWSGDASGQANPLAVTLNSNMVVNAFFARAGALLVDTVGRGIVRRQPDQAEYSPGTEVVLTAEAAPGYSFDGWSGDVSGKSPSVTVLMAGARRVVARFLDAQPPVVTLHRPIAGVTSDERVELAGSVSDNVRVASVTWDQNGRQGGSLSVAGNTIRMWGLRLEPGTNHFTVVARDDHGHEGMARTEVVWEPLRGLIIGTPPEQREGGKVLFPIQLESQGDVGGMSFQIAYDPDYLKDPVWRWSGAAGASASSVNTNLAGEVRATFSLGGGALPAGTQLVAEVRFRTRSVPGQVTTEAWPRVLDLSGTGGQPFVFGTAEYPGSLRILPRRVKGDNNANDRLDIGDATLAQRLLTSLDPVRAWDVTGNDLNETDTLDSGDVTRVLRVVVGMDPQPLAGVGALASADTTPPRSGVGVRALHALAPPPEGAVLLLPTTMPRPSETVVLQVLLTNLESRIAGASFYLDYPVDTLRLTAHKPGAFPPQGAAQLWNEQQPGRLAFAASSAEPWQGTNGVLAEVSFEVLRAATLADSLLLSGIEVTADGFENRSLRDATISLARGPGPAPVIDPVASDWAGPDFLLVFTAQPGATCEVLASSDLVAWTLLGAVTVTAADGAAAYTDRGALILSRRYYQVRIR